MELCPFIGLGQLVPFKQLSTETYQSNFLPAVVYISLQKERFKELMKHVPCIRLA